MNTLIIPAIFCSENECTANISLTLADEQIYIFRRICYAKSVETSFCFSLICPPLLSKLSVMGRLKQPNYKSRETIVQGYCKSLSKHCTRDFI